MASSLSDPPPTPLSFPKLRNGPARTYDPLATHGTLIEPVADAPEPNPTKDYDRFDIVRLFAQGGQGHVFVARDTQLNREVALKELQPRFADRTLSRARFVREAEITGSLEHPGVVPVYALGHHEGGRPYYAMRLIQGRNLQEVIQEFHDPNSGLTDAERNIKFRQLLQRFVSVCQTIAYAHSRSIVHRDIKPSNVLIGSYGEAVVVDWGLARPFHPTAGCANDPEANAPVDTGPAAPSGRTRSPNDSTLMGTALGTPAFMSPEQADGRWDLVGPASDIYALGTSLYVLVTGEMPIEFSDWPTMAQKIRSGDIPRARQVKPDVPRALEAICQKSMALRPADRYSTALELAGDIEHWLADEPVVAWREPLHYRAARWGRRHRTLVASVAALCVTALVGLAVGLVAVNQERRRTELERGKTADALVVADTRRNETREALDRTVSQAMQDTFERQRVLNKKQREFLTKTLVDYERFANDTPTDLKGQLGVVSAYRRVGEIRMRLHMLSEALDPLTQALRRCETLSIAHKNNDELNRELAQVHSALGSLYRETGHSAESLRELAASLSIRKELASRYQNDNATQRDLAAGYANHAAAIADAAKKANKHEIKEQYLRVVEAIQSALKIREDIAAKSNLADDRLQLAIVLNNLGWALLVTRAHDNCDDKAGQCNYVEQAEATYRRSKDIGEALVAESADESGYREALAAACQMLGKTQLLSDHANPNKEQKDARRFEAIKNFELAATHNELLATDYPGVPKYGLDADGIRVSLANLLSKMNKDTWAALQQYDLVIQRLEKVKAMELSHKKLLVQAFAGRADALTELKRFEDAIDARSKLVEINPERRGIWRSLRALNRLDLAKQKFEDFKLRSSQLELAFAEIDELITATEPVSDGETIYNCACFYAQASLAITERGDEFMRKAVELLKVADKRGYLNADSVDSLKKDKDLQPLFDRSDFKEFCEQLSKSASKSNP